MICTRKDWRKASTSDKHGDERTALAQRVLVALEQAEIRTFLKGISYIRPDAHAVSLITRYLCQTRADLGVVTLLGEFPDLTYSLKGAVLEPLNRK